MLTVPISIIKYALYTKKVNQLKLYLYLKSIASGQIRLTQKTKEQILKGIEWKDQRTLETNLEWLLKHHWTAYNSKTQSLRITSFGRLHYKIKGRVCTGVRMNSEDLKTFRAFIYASIITWSMNERKRLIKKSERTEGHSKKDIPYSHYFQMPTRYLAPILDLDHSTISRYKKIAQQSGYIKVHHQYENLQRHPQYLPIMKEYSEEETAKKLVIHNKRVHIQNADLISSTLEIRYIKRLKPYKKKPP